MHEVPLTRIERLDPAPLEAALRNLADVRWILLTSVNAVEVLADAVAATGTADALADRYVAVVGEVTAQAAEAHGWRADMVPAQFSAEGLLDAFASRTDVAGTTALYPCAARCARRAPRRAARAGSPRGRDSLLPRASPIPTGSGCSRGCWRPASSIW